MGVCVYELANPSIRSSSILLSQLPQLACHPFITKFSFPGSFVPYPKCVRSFTQAYREVACALSLPFRVCFCARERKRNAGKKKRENGKNVNLYLDYQRPGPVGDKAARLDRSLILICLFSLMSLPTIGVVDSAMQ